jgi:hypothetical protein
MMDEIPKFTRAATAPARQQILRAALNEIVAHETVGSE